MKTYFRGVMSIVIATMTLSVSGAPLFCDPRGSCSLAGKWQDIENQDELTTSQASEARQITELPAHNMPSIEQEILFALLKTQAEDRREIRKTARLALFNLQRMADSNQYNQSAAKELTTIYGNALAELAYLDIQLAFQFRNMLSVESRALQGKLNLKN
jgi:hypothetical protein